MASKLMCGISKQIHTHFSPKCTDVPIHPPDGDTVTFYLILLITAVDGTDDDYANGCPYLFAKRAKTATPSKQTTPTEPYMTW